MFFIKVGKNNFLKQTTIIYSRSEQILEQNAIIRLFLHVSLQ